ncbi:MAG: TlpA disulfide reductase family protein, partial [Bacteroidota bacterium]
HSKFLNIYIKEDIQSFSTKDEFYNQNFVYQLKDTIKLDGGYYRIDSLKNDFSGLFIKRLHMVKDFSDGFRIGDIMQAYPLKNLSGANFEIPRKGSSDYLLLDFWGTWCPPCREMLPDIKNLKHKFSDRLEVVGIALDKSPEVVQNYCSKNDIDWKQTYLNIEEPNHFILKNLSIKVYPTLILLDKNNKIVYRGSDISGIKEIEKIISQ